MLNHAHIAAHAQIDANSWFECSWGEGPFSMSEVLGIVLTSNDPVAAANQYHTTDAKTGQRVALRDFLIHLQRPEDAGKVISNGESEMFEHLLESITANCE